MANTHKHVHSEAGGERCKAREQSLEQRDLTSAERLLCVATSEQIVHVLGLQNEKQHCVKSETRTQKTRFEIKNPMTTSQLWNNTKTNHKPHT